jgi:hypothetical protein
VTKAGHCGIVIEGGLGTVLQAKLMSILAPCQCTVFYAFGCVVLVRPRLHLLRVIVQKKTVHKKGPTRASNLRLGKV